jgi:hypothetical protein
MDVSPEKKMPLGPGGIVRITPGVRRRNRRTCPSIFSFYIFFVAFKTAFWVRQNTRANTTPWVPATTSLDPPGGRDKRTPGVSAIKRSATYAAMTRFILYI